MEAITVATYILFLLACFGLAWTALRTFIQAFAICAKVGAGHNVKWDFTVELWLLPLCFTYIMGFICIL